MMTAMPQAACLTEARFPVWREARIGVGFHEVNARQSDFAFVSAAAQVAIDADGRCTRAAARHRRRDAVPLRLDAVGAALTGTRLTEPRFARPSRRRLPTSNRWPTCTRPPTTAGAPPSTLAVRAIADAHTAAQREARMQVELPSTATRTRSRSSRA